MVRTSTRCRPILLLAVVFTLLFGLLAAKPAHAATFTVNSSADTNDGLCQQPTATFPTRDCTLREAINAANNTPGADTIGFDIPGAGVRTIFPNSALPKITEQVTIDGYTQPGSTPNTEPQPGKTDANPLIELDGTNAGTGATGLLIGSSGAAVSNNVVVRGLVINRFGAQGVFANAGAGHRVEGNFIGTDPSGAQDDEQDDPGNVKLGVLFFGISDGVVGGTSLDARNVVSGNGATGVALSNGAQRSRVEGNLIGTDKDGTGDLGNSFNGVAISGSDNTVGDADAAGGETNASNTIAFNDRNGVAVVGAASTGNGILRNSIFSNDELGIDLKDDGVTPNDRKDPDIGPNNLQNFPVLTSATTAGPPTGTTITGKLKSTRKQTFTIQFFANPEADPSGFGEGKVYVGELTGVKTNRKGNASFTFNDPNLVLFSNRVITATATKEATGATSEFSNAVSAS